MEIKSNNLRKILGLDEPPRRVTEKVRGVMTFDHKTGGSVQVMSAESYERNKKYIENTFNLIKTLEIEL